MLSPLEYDMIGRDFKPQEYATGRVIPKLGHRRVYYQWLFKTGRNSPEPDG